MLMNFKTTCCTSSIQTRPIPLDNSPIAGKAKKEVFHDEDGRKLLFMISFEDMMRKMMTAVERHHPFPELALAKTSPLAAIPADNNAGSPSSDLTAVATGSLSSNA